METATTTMKDPKQYPTLRNLQFSPIKEGEDQFVVLWDPTGLSKEKLVLPLNYFFIVQHFDGDHSIQEIGAIYLKRFGEFLMPHKVEQLIAELEDKLFLEGTRSDTARQQALEVYRERFQPSAQLDRPYAMVGVNVIAADTDEEARHLFTSAQQSFTNLFRGTRGKLQPPIDDIETYWTPSEKAQAMNMLSCSFVGSAATVQSGLENFIAQTGADEVMVAAAIYDHSKRLRSYEILSDVHKAMSKAA